MMRAVLLLGGRDGGDGSNVILSKFKGNCYLVPQCIHPSKQKYINRTRLIPNKLALNVGQRLSRQKGVRLGTKLGVIIGNAT